ncbi:hypothetical protein M426DRAFT_224496 [Hypoxylon sp. CI-4A]|nr:hypothetical protein M426DRAFT_224496 [Hypoxylon sp. CI-4A]
MGDRKKIHRAVTNAHLDFPGENRISQAQDHVSTRLRRNLLVVDQTTGTLRRLEVKYTEDGILMWEYRAPLMGIRWNDSSELECEVRWRLPRFPKTSWEPLRAIMTPYGEFRLRKFYKDMLQDEEYVEGTSNPSYLDAMKTTPSPRVVFDSGVSKLVKGLNLHRQWEKMILTWDARIEMLEEAAARENGDATGQGQSESREG